MKLMFGNCNKDNIYKATDIELSEALCSLDGCGKQNKELILSELLSRAYEKGYDLGWKAGIEQATGE